MRKDFGPQTWVYPTQVLIIGTYNENNEPNAMNAALINFWLKSIDRVLFLYQ
jgi:hypothetical protein